jgi:hypothetical protein
MLLGYLASGLATHIVFGATSCGIATDACAFATARVYVLQGWIDAGCHTTTTHGQGIHHKVCQSGAFIARIGLFSNKGLTFFTVVTIACGWTTLLVDGF